VTSFTRNGPDDGSGGQQPSAMDDEVFTEYGSIFGSFPPSPTLSFRSAIDAPGFNRYIFYWQTFFLFFISGETRE
jgi:hypothetical protein